MFSPPARALQPSACRLVYHIGDAPFTCPLAAYLATPSRRSRAFACPTFVRREPVHRRHLLWHAAAKLDPSQATRNARLGRDVIENIIRTATSQSRRYGPARRPFSLPTARRRTGQFRNARDTLGELSPSPAHAAAGSHAGLDEARRFRPTIMACGQAESSGLFQSARQRRELIGVGMQSIRRTIFRAVEARPADR